MVYISLGEQYTPNPPPFTPPLFTLLWNISFPSFIDVRVPPLHVYMHILKYTFMCIHMPNVRH